MRSAWWWCWVLVGCEGGTLPPDDAADVAVVDAADAAGEVATTDVGAVDVTDAGAPGDAVAFRDVAPGTECSFNRDCGADQRCACTETGGCHCEVGPRGTGRAGVDTCASGNDCASALCVQGTSGDLCSDACATAADCPSTLPRCLTVPLVGRFCARDPSGASDGGVSMLTATFGSRTGGFDRAVHGLTGTDGIYLEAHFGGMTGCPTMTSPTPRRTLVVTGLHAISGAQTEAMGVRANLFDFGGDLTSAPLLRATAVTATVRATDRTMPLTIELRAVFAEGSIAGTVTTLRCASLDG